jgi:hypothetical protein
MKRKPAAAIDLWKFQQTTRVRRPSIRHLLLIRLTGWQSPSTDHTVTIFSSSLSHFAEMLETPSTAPGLFTLGHCVGASGHTYNFTRQGNGTTDIDVDVVREGKNLKGQLLGFVLGTVGKGVLEKAFVNSVKAIEARNGAAGERIAA